MTLPPDLLTEVDDVARRLRMSRSAVVADALRTRLADMSRPPRAAGVAESAGTSYPAGLSDEALLDALRRRLTERSTAEPHPPGSASLRLRYDHEQLAVLCRRHHIARLSLFGSVLTAEFSPDSDVDVLVEFARGHTPGLAIADLEDELSALFGGRRVDVVTERSLHRLIRDRVLASAVVQFAA